MSEGLEKKMNGLSVDGGEKKKKFNFGASEFTPTWLPAAAAPAPFVPQSAPVQAEKPAGPPKVLSIGGKKEEPVKAEEPKAELAAQSVASIPSLASFNEPPKEKQPGRLICITYEK
jgi:hypothetical protein